MSKQPIDASLFMPLLLSVQTQLIYTKDCQQTLFTFFGSYVHMCSHEQSLTPLSENGVSLLASAASDQLANAYSELQLVIDTIKALQDEIATVEIPQRLRQI